MHGLFVLLLTIGTIRGIQASKHPTYLAAGCLLLAAWYATGLVLQRRSATFGMVWFVVLFAGWAALVLVSAELSWVVFALFFLALHLLPRPAALSAVVLGTAVVISAQLSRPSAATVPSIIGPCLGAIVAIGIAWIYKQLRDESAQRLALNAELVAAQSDLIAAHDALAGSQRESGVLAERARLAREVHDTLAQSFSSIVLLSRAARSGAPDAERLHDIVGRIEQVAQSGLTDAREVVQALTPSELEQAPISAALQRLVERQDEGPQLSLVVEGEVTHLPTAVEVALLRLAQGAIANVRQHSDADRAVVTLTGSPSQVDLDVRDDGRGFDPTVPIARTATGGYGLAAMRDRVRELGGSLDVESAVGEGTAVHVEIPLGGSE